MRLLKKLAVILILGCLFVQAGGYFFLYLSRRTEIRNEMHAFVRSSDCAPFLTKLHFEKRLIEDEASGFAWHDDREEFEFNNEMFDVVRIEDSGESIAITCVRDRDEEGLETQMLALHRSSSKPGKQLPSLLKFFSSLYTLQQHPEMTASITDVEKGKTPYRLFLTNRVMEVIAPPPRCC